MVLILDKQGPRELNMWGTVQDLLQNAATLPDEEDTKVVRLAAAMLIFFIVCIVLLLVYLVCRYQIAEQMCSVGGGSQNFRKFPHKKNVFLLMLPLTYNTVQLSLMLMYGSVRGSRWLILPWLVATLLFIVAYCAGMVLSTILFGVNVLSLAFLAIAIIESCIALYLWLCVISLFQHLADRQTNTQVCTFLCAAMTMPFGLKR